MSREIPVGICLERGQQLLVTMLAVLKAGGAYVPLDPGYPSERLAYMLEDSGATIVVSSAGLRGTVPTSTQCQVLEWEQLEPVFGSYPTIDPHRDTTGEQLACILYTSGSTGRPKGVMIEHRAIGGFVQWMLDTFTPEERAVVLASTSLNFDMSILELLGTLAGGGHMMLAGNILQLAESSSYQAVTWVSTVPSALRELLELEAIPSSVRAICSAGEPLPASLVDEIYANTYPTIKEVLSGTV